MRYLFEAARELQAVLEDTDTALQAFLERGSDTAFGCFWRYHLPLLGLIPLATLVSPLHRIFAFFELGPQPGVAILYVLPVLAVIGWLFFVSIYDQVIEFARPPALRKPDDIRIRNVGSYLHLPLSGTAPFFFIHPFLGLVALLFVGAYTTYQTVEGSARSFGETRARVFVHLLSTGILILIPVAVLLLLGNMMRTYTIFRDLF